jgi:hypothetical protein
MARGTRKVGTRRKGSNTRKVGERKVGARKVGARKVGARKVGGKWSMKYKKSINCKHPKGFSQKQHCKYGRKNLKI